MKNPFCFRPLAGRHRVNTRYCFVTLLPLACEVSGIVPASKVFEIPPRNTSIKCHLRAHASSPGDLDFWTRRQTPNRNSEEYPRGKKSSPHYIVRCNAYLGSDNWVYTAILAVSLKNIEPRRQVLLFWPTVRAWRASPRITYTRLEKDTCLFGKKNGWQLNSCSIPTDFIVHCAVSTIAKLDQMNFFSRRSCQVLSFFTWN